MVKRKWKIVILLVLGLLIAGGCKEKNYSISKPDNVEQFFVEVDNRHQDFEDEHNGLLRDLAKQEQQPTDKKLIEYYEQYKAEKKEMLKKELQVLNSYDFAELTEQQRISAKTVKWGLQIQQEELQYYDNHFLIPRTSLKLMTTLRDFDIKDKADIDKYFAKLNQLKGNFIVEKSLIERKKEQGNLVSQPVIKNTIEQCQRFIAMEDVTKSRAYDRFKNQVEKLDISTKGKEKSYAKLEEELKTEVYPMYQEYVTYLSQLPKEASIEGGVWELPQGKEFYEFLFKKYTTTEMTPEEAFTLAKEEVKEKKRELVNLLKENGYENIEQNRLYFGQLEGDKVYFPKQVMAEYKEVLAESKERLPELFNTLAKAKVEVRKKKSSSGSAYYNKDKNAFYINPNRTPMSMYRIKYLAYHEALPGHHFQISIGAERNKKLAYQQDLYLASYTEGWATYSEQLAYEYDFYDTPIQKMKHLQNQLQALMFIVGDIGINYKGWSLSEVHYYVKEVTGYLPHSYSYGRPLFRPGQHTSYGIGLLKMNSLRAKAKDELGPKFNIKEFHDIILRNGKLPLRVLEEEVDKYINETIEN